MPLKNHQDKRLCGSSQRNRERARERRGWESRRDENEGKSEANENLVKWRVKEIDRSNTISSTILIKFYWCSFCWFHRFFFHIRICMYFINAMKTLPYEIQNHENKWQKLLFLLFFMPPSNASEIGRTRKRDEIKKEVRRDKRASRVWLTLVHFIRIDYDRIDLYAISRWKRASKHYSGSDKKWRHRPEKFV